VGDGQRAGAGRPVPGRPQAVSGRVSQPVAPYAEDAQAVHAQAVRSHAGDDDRGMMLLEWGSKPEFKTWPAQPTFRTYKLSQILNTPEDLLKEKMHCRVTIDVNISFEEANFVKETFVPQYKLRELMLIPEKVEVDAQSAPIDINFESVDTIVMNQINAIDSDTFDKAMLLEIYNNL
jgi:hypothetical protein